MSSRRRAVAGSVLAIAALAASAPAASAAPTAVAARSCAPLPSVQVANLTIVRQGTGAFTGAKAGAFSCVQASLVAKQHRRLSEREGRFLRIVRVRGIRYQCRLIGTGTQDAQCLGAGTRIRWAEPTG